MLSRDQLEGYEKILMNEIATRRPLGGYSPEAGTILMLCEMMFEITRHIRERMPAPKRKVDDDE
jgi:hypothetical protein